MNDASREIEILYFAAARELVGSARERVPLPQEIGTVAGLSHYLAERHPRLSPVIHRMRLAVNGELAKDDAPLAPGDEISVLPPVAGGVDPVCLCEVRDTRLSLDEVLEAIRHPGAGGVTLFIGIVRDHADGKPVARLDYEAHPTMASQELRRVLVEVAAEHEGARLATVHRVGQLAVGDLAIVVGASSPHRAEAFAACRAVIEAIKERVPIWKKEWAPDGSANWVNLDG